MLVLLYTLERQKLLLFNRIWWLQRVSLLAGAPTLSAYTYFPVFSYGFDNCLTDPNATVVRENPV